MCPLYCYFLFIFVCYHSSELFHVNEVLLIFASLLLYYSEMYLNLKYRHLQRVVLGKQNCSHA